MLLRDARPEDAPAIALVHVRAWQAGYRGLVPAESLDRMKAEDRAPHYTLGSVDPDQPATLVAETAGIVGFVTTVPARGEADAGSGEVAALHVDPTCWRHGIGAALLEAAHHRLAERGFIRAVLWLVVGNDRALRFYRRFGWVPNGRTQTQEVWGVVLQEMQLERQLGEAT
jgi:ribosomal protein S18 acetylase RimI-like enzyme